jgi:hypothetical protein
MSRRACVMLSGCACAVLELWENLRAPPSIEIARPRKKNSPTMTCREEKSTGGPRARRRRFEVATRDGASSAIHTSREKKIKKRRERGWNAVTSLAADNSRIPSLWRAGSSPPAGRPPHGRAKLEIACTRHIAMMCSLCTATLAGLETTAVGGAGGKVVVVNIGSKASGGGPHLSGAGTRTIRSSRCDRGRCGGGHG